MFIIAVVVVLCALFVSGVQAKSLPIVFMYGILGEASDWEEFGSWITEAYPDTYVKFIEIGDNQKMDSTFANFNEFLVEVADQIKNDSELQDGFVFIGHSQGGLIARAYIEMYNDPPARKLITLSSPHGGIYCAPNGGCWIPVDEQFMNLLEYMVSEFLYTDYFQENFMAAAYWRDPYILDKYYTECRGLPYFNNEVDFDEKRRQNFSSLEGLKLIWSDIDEIIVPNESAKFQYFKANTEELYEFDETPLYTQDLIGLRELYESGRVEFVNSHMLHNGYKHNHDFFLEHILDFIHVEV